MYCNNCGEEIIKNAKFCTKCGQNLISVKKKKKFNYLFKIGIGVIIILCVGVLLFYANKDYVDNYEDESLSSLFEIFNPYIEPVGYYSEPDLFDSQNIESEEWFSYIKYVNENQTQETSLLNTNIPNQSEVLGSVVKIVCEDDDSYYTGSGTNFDSSGYVLTNLHVIEDTDQCAVGFANPKSGLIEELYWATPIIDKDNITGHDLAYLSIEDPIFDEELNIYGYFDKVYKSQLPYFKIREECADREIQLGDQIFVMGYPSLSGGALTVTNGLVSSLYSRDGYIITSAKINSGNSGGLAIDKLGCYVGVPTAVYYEDGGESFGEIIDAEFVVEFDDAIEDDLNYYVENL